MNVPAGMNSFAQMANDCIEVKGRVSDNGEGRTHPSLYAESSSEQGHTCGHAGPPGTVSQLLYRNIWAVHETYPILAVFCAPTGVVAFEGCCILDFDPSIFVIIEAFILSIKVDCLTLRAEARLHCRVAGTNARAALDIDIFSRYVPAEKYLIGPLEFGIGARILVEGVNNVHLRRLRI